MRCTLLTPLQKCPKPSHSTPAYHGTFLGSLKCLVQVGHARGRPEANVLVECAGYRHTHLHRDASRCVGFAVQV